MNLSSPQETYLRDQAALAEAAHAGRRRSWWRRNGSTLLLLSPLLLFMIGVFAAPMIFQIAFAFFERVLVAGVLWLPKPAFYLGNFYQAFADPVYRYSIFFTVGVALVTTIANILLALPVAYFLARMNVVGRSIIELSFLLPIFGEIFTIYALAYALTPQGPFNWLLTNLKLISTPLSIVGNPWVVIVWMSLPTLSVLLIRSAFSNVDIVYEEAAQTMGASPWKIFFRVTVPLAKNGIAGAFLLVFSAGVGAYTIPLVLVGPYNDWLTNKIQREINPYFNYPMASALGVILPLICALLFYLYLGTQEEKRSDS
ncbi:MAG TPA: ABC transporter permease [Caldilineaceae bacterium]|nr:ABC transporter permease [Caldilineaceae bacterium]